MKILISDPTYKHALALARYLKNYDRSLKIIGVSSYKPRFPSLFASHYDGFLVGDLKEVIHAIPHDLFIPVGNTSVEIASTLGFQTAVLPSPSSIEIGLSKQKTLSLAENLKIPIPATYTISSIHEIDRLDIKYPCVVKGVLEAGKNVVSYPKNILELKNEVKQALDEESQKNQMPIIQEYVPGVGLGFFGFYQKGVLKRFYMHQRIREYPITGGASTAAKTIYHEEAFNYSKKLLDALNWHGPAMVEFKYDPKSKHLALMEINPKFWGSTELGLAAGVNFGELLIKTARGEEIAPQYSPDSYRTVTFCWPFEGDLTAIWKTKQWRAYGDYFRKEVMTNTRTNGFWLNCFRVLEMNRK